ncbi:MAG: helix-turn-helix domain-containing protein [Motiliproteus sp.]
MMDQQDFLCQLDTERTDRIQAQIFIQRESLHDTIRATLESLNDWFCSTEIREAFGWRPGSVMAVAQRMHDQGLLERRQHFYGTNAPGTGYRGFRYEFKQVAKVEG